MILGYKRFNCILRSCEKKKHISRSEKFKLCTVWRNNAYETTRKRIRCAFILPKRKGVTLTSNGEILLTYAKQIIHLIDQSVKSSSK